MTEPNYGIETQETAEEEARRLGVSARTVFRRRAQAKRLIDQCSDDVGSDGDTSAVTRVPAGDVSDNAWALLVESLRDTIKRQEREIDRQAQSINRLEGLLYSLPQPPAEEVPHPSPIAPVETPRPQPPNLTVVVISFLVGVAVMWFLSMK